MTNKALLAMAAAFALAGCASKQPVAKSIHERPWIGGEFETAPSPKLARERGFKRNGALVTRAAAETPLAKAGVRETDLILAINDVKVGSDHAARRALSKISGPAKLALFRAGEITEATVTPGVERFQNVNNLTFAIGLSPRFEVDLFPNPDFNLIALGYESEDKLLDLTSPKGKFLTATQPPQDSAWQGLRSEEGWKTWLGPISVSRNRVIVSQEFAK